MLDSSSLHREILPANEIYAVDLLTALDYTFTREIAKHRFFEGDSMIALRNYVTVLDKVCNINFLGEQKAHFTSR